MEYPTDNFIFSTFLIFYPGYSNDAKYTFLY